MARYSSPPVAPREIEAGLRNHFAALDASLKVHAIRHEHAHPREELTRATRHLAEWRSQVGKR